MFFQCVRTVMRAYVCWCACARLPTCCVRALTCTHTGTHGSCRCDLTPTSSPCPRSIPTQSLLQLFLNIADSIHKIEKLMGSDDAAAYVLGLSPYPTCLSHRADSPSAGVSMRIALMAMRYGGASPSIPCDSSRLAMDTLHKLETSMHPLFCQARSLPIPSCPSHLLSSGLTWDVACNSE